MGNLANYFSSPAGVAVFGGILFLVLMTNACHEGSHALVAFARGDRRASVRDRCTLNPIKHFHWFLTLVLPVLVLWASNGQALLGGAKPVMVQPGRVGRVGMVLVSLAGPLANALFGGFLIALLGLLIHMGWHLPFDPDAGRFDWVRSYAWRLFYFPLWFSFVLTLLNLLPLPGLDGGHVVGACLPEKARRIWYLLTPATFVLLLGFVLWQGHLLAAWGIGSPPEGPSVFTLIEGRVTSYVGAMVNWYGEVL